MKKSILAMVVAASFVSSIAYAGTISDAEQAAAFSQFEQGAMNFNTLPDGTPDAQILGAYNDAIAGLKRMGITGANAEDVIANYNNYSNAADVYAWTKTPVPEAPNTMLPGASQNPAGNAVSMLAGHKNDPTGEPVAVAQQAQAKLTADKYAAANGPHDGVNGKDGIAGVNGVNGVTTVITKADNSAVESEAAQRQAADYTQRKAIVTNSQAIDVQQGQILSHSRAIADNTAQIQQNSQKIDKLNSQQDTDRKAAKAGAANALAVSGLHYVDTDNSIAIGAGTYEGQNAGSFGYRHKFTENVAATIAASQDSNGGTGAAASLALGW